MVGFANMSSSPSIQAGKFVVGLGFIPERTDVSVIVHSISSRCRRHHIRIASRCVFFCNWLEEAVFHKWVKRSVSQDAIASKSLPNLYSHANAIELAAAVRDVLCGDCQELAVVTVLLEQTEHEFQELYGPICRVFLRLRCLFVVADAELRKHCVAFCCMLAGAVAAVVLM